MKINRSYILAAGLFIIIALWFAINTIGKDNTIAGVTQAQTRAQIEAKSEKPSVQIQRITAQTHDNILKLFGQSEAFREVNVKAKTAGLVTAAPIAEGRIIPKGTVLCRQDIDARQAVLNQALANMRSIETDLNAARILAQKGYQSEMRVISFEAQLDGAKANIEQARIELDNINMRAPFDGVWEHQDAQIGDYLTPGQSCGLLVDLSPLQVIVQLTEAQFGRVKIGTEADIALATGETVRAKITSIEAKANPNTRTFRTVLQLDNPQYALKAGVTATVRIKTGQSQAHQIPSNILALSDDGTIGVRYVDTDNIVRFSHVETIDENPKGIWVTGLPETVDIIIEGQNFVSEGMEVKAEANYQASRKNAIDNSAP